MLDRLLALPLVVLVMGLGAVSMMVPAIHALAVDDHHVARAFFYFGLLFLKRLSDVFEDEVHPFEEDDDEVFRDLARQWRFGGHAQKNQSGPVEPQTAPESDRPGSEATLPARKPRPAGRDRGA